MSTAISIEQVAQLQAEMDAGATAEEVLDHFGLDRDAYLTAKEEYLGAIADEMRGGRRVLLKRYQQAFVGHVPVVARPTQDDAVHEEAPPTAPTRSPVGDPGEQLLPTFLQSRAADTDELSPRRPLAAHAAPASVMPFRDEPLGEPFLAEQTVIPESSTPISTAPSTQPAVVAPLIASTPFVPVPLAGVPRPPRPGSTPVMPAVAVTPGQKETMTMDRSLLFGPGAPLHGHPDAPPLRPPPAAPQPVAPAADLSLAVKAGETLEIDRTKLAELAAQQGSPTPFAKRSPAPAPAPPPAAFAPTPPHHFNERRMGGTMPSRDSAGGAPLSPEEVFRHASLKGDLARGQEPPEVILARWGFTEETRADYDARWMAQMAGDPAARAMWMEVYRARKA